MQTKDNKSKSDCDLFDEEYNDIQLSEWPLSPEKPENNMNEILNKKRKLENENETENDEHLQSVAKIVCRTSSDSPINHRFADYKTNGLVKRNVSSLYMQSPLNAEAFTSIISRKNLLSLSKLKKGNSQEHESPTPSPNQDTSTSTPLPKAARRKIEPDTPNLKEFFNSIPDASTPRPMMKHKNILQNISNAEHDSVCNTPTKLKSCKNASIISGGNESFSAQNPSPQQRIERLSIYGQPPAISPIVITNKSRSLGLRRGRSAQKPK